MFTKFIANMCTYRAIITLAVLFLRSSYTCAQGDMHNNVHYEIIYNSVLKI